MTIETETHGDNGASTNIPRLGERVHDAPKTAAAARGEAARARIGAMMKRLDAAMKRHPLAFAMAGMAAGYVVARVRARR